MVVHYTCLHQKGFVEGYCRDDSERRLMSEQIQQKIDAINAEIEKNGPSL